MSSLEYVYTSVHIPLRAGGVAAVFCFIVSILVDDCVCAIDYLDCNDPLLLYKIYLIHQQSISGLITLHCLIIWPIIESALSIAYRRSSSKLSHRRLNCDSDGLLAIFYSRSFLPLHVSVC